MKKQLLICCGLFIGCTITHAQVDPHFAQYYVYPSWLNPALTGAFNGSFRLSGIYRSQWGKWDGLFTNKGLSADFSTPQNVNLGVTLLNQSAGDGGYNYTTAYFNFAYTGVRFGKSLQHRIVFGIQGGVIDRRFNKSRLTFGDQWNPVTGYSPNNITNEIITKPSATNLDLGAGLLYFDGTPGKKINIYGGASITHLNKPEDKFMAMGDNQLPYRITYHGGFRIKFSEEFSLTPNFLYLTQGTAKEKMVGLLAQMKAGTTTDVLLGFNYRVKDAYSPYFGVSFKNMLLGISYDINNSEWARKVNGSNSFELSLTFFKFRKVRSEEVDFVCPRL